MPTRKRNGQRPDNRRQQIADEAARIIIESGTADYRAAKAKAQERLGLSSGPLPGNEEIEAALASRNRIFRGERHTAHLRDLREMAADLMLRLQSFRPKLVGSVLSGNATDHSAIDLHLFSDTPELVAMRLEALDLFHKPIQFFPGFRFSRFDQQTLGYQ